MQLRQQLEGRLPAAALRQLSNRFDVIGDIAVLQLPPVLYQYRAAIADAITSHRHEVRIVLLKKTKLEGEDRTAQYEVLSGEGSTVTTHYEYGHTYRLDVRTVFFNPGLASERRRVTGMVEPGEKVIVPFGGVGPFAIPAAVRGAEVVAIERNPEACRWFLENCRLNGCADRISLIRSDALLLSLREHNRFDRAIIPAPYGMNQCPGVFSPFVKADGMIHFYAFKKRSQIEEMARGYEKQGFTVIGTRRCGNVAPSVSRWAFDLKKTG